MQPPEARKKLRFPSVARWDEPYALSGLASVEDERLERQDLVVHLRKVKSRESPPETRKQRFERARFRALPAQAVFCPFAARLALKDLRRLREADVLRGPEEEIERLRELAEGL